MVGGVQGRHRKAHLLLGGARALCRNAPSESVEHVGDRKGRAKRETYGGRDWRLWWVDLLPLHPPSDPVTAVHVGPGPSPLRRSAAGHHTPPRARGPRLLRLPLREGPGANHRRRGGLALLRVHRKPSAGRCRGDGEARVQWALPGPAPQRWCLRCTGGAGGWGSGQPLSRGWGGGRLSPPQCHGAESGLLRQSRDDRMVLGSRSLANITAADNHRERVPPKGCMRTAVHRRTRRGAPPPPPPLPMFEADSQNFAAAPSAPRGFELKIFRPTFGGNRRGTQGGGGVRPTPPPPLRPPGPSPRPLSNTSLVPPAPQIKVTIVRNLRSGGLGHFWYTSFWVPDRLRPLSAHVSLAGSCLTTGSKTAPKQSPRSTGAAY